MTFLSEFSYPDISQRRIILLNSIISFIALSFIYIHSAIILNYYFIYHPVLRLVFISASIGIFSGNLLGKLLFNKFEKHSIIYAIADILFILSCSLFIYSKLIIPDNNSPLLYLFSKNQFFVFLPLFVISVFAGIKINYFLKISCGDFIDNKRAAIPFLLFLLIGIALGFLLAVIFYYFKWLYYFSGVLLLFIIPTIFKIKLSYNPAPIYAQEAKKNLNLPAEQNENYKRGDLFFIYLNFTYILVYLFLGFTCIVKYFGDFLYVKIIFIFISLLSLTIGILSARIVKYAFWYIYAEMLYPVFFIISSVLLILLKDDLSFYAAILIFIPILIIFGFSFFYTIDHILSSNNHKNRFNVLEFSLLILPPPILISLSFVDFTYFWYYILLYIIALMNIFVPGIYLMQTKIKEYKKIMFFVCALLFIPLLILMHLYFNIPLNRTFYISYAAGFDNLSYINYNSPYIDNEVAVYNHKIKLFHADDPSIRNLKRSIVPAMLYSGNKWDEVLLIDGNQKFFKNPVISLLTNITCLDYVPGRITDYKTLPITGDQNYILDSSEIISYLGKIKAPFKMIVDIPNLFDQTLNAFRFSKEYYNIINNYLIGNGIFIQVISSSSRKELLAYSAKNIKRTFKKTIGFYFPNYLVFISSNNSDALKLTTNNINSFKEVFDSKTELKNLFYNEIHLLSHIIFLDIDDLLVYMDKDELSPFYALNNPKKFQLDKNIIAGYSDNNSLFINLIDKSISNIYFLNLMQNQLAVNIYYLPEIKIAELSEMNKDYEKESAQLINLRRNSEYKPDLRKYISDILAYKENYYYNAALRFEKEKKWEVARRLYKAILTINKNNFEANYRLGILSIILQDLNSSFEYLQYAMQLKRDNPKVFSQMGILLYSSGRPRDALQYLERALELKEKTASLFYYLGLCHEELNNIAGAINYYNQAIILDPNDKNIISSIERIKEKTNSRQIDQKSEDQINNKEVEQGEDMPLPVSDAAINYRIEEDKSVSNKQKEQKK